MLDVAEKCFVRIADAILARGISVREAFRRQIQREIARNEDGGKEEELELLSPIGFLEGVKGLGIGDLEEQDVACLMRILTKPDLENSILLQELIIIMENFGIQDKATAGRESSKEEVPREQRRSAGAIDLSQLDEKSIKILAKLMLALMELGISLHEFFEGVIYEQMVKTKQAAGGARKVEIIEAKDFFDYLQGRGVRKSA